MFSNLRIAYPACALIILSLTYMHRSDESPLQAISYALIATTAFLTHIELAHIGTIAAAKGHTSTSTRRLMFSWSFATCMSIFFGVTQISTENSPQKMVTTFIILFTLMLASELFTSSPKTLDDIENHEDYQTDDAPRRSYLWGYVSLPVAITALWIFLSLDNERSIFSGSAQNLLAASFPYIITIRLYTPRRSSWRLPSYTAITNTLFFLAIITVYLSI